MRLSRVVIAFAVLLLLVFAGFFLTGKSPLTYLTGGGGFDQNYELEIRWNGSAYVIWEVREDRPKPSFRVYELDHGFSTFFNFTNRAGHDVVVELIFIDRASGEKCPINRSDCRDGITRLIDDGSIVLFSNPLLTEEDLDKQYTFEFRIGRFGGGAPTVIDPELQIDSN